MKGNTLLLHSRHPLTKPQRLSLFTLICIGLALSIILFTRLRDFEQSKFSTDFKVAAENRIFALQSSIEDKMNEIVSLEALFNTSEQVDRADFQTFTRLLLQHKTGIQALEWIPHVSFAERQSYEELARKNGISNFQITEREGQGQMVPAGKRDAYFPVYYVEPIESNELALGFDLASNPLRFEALKSSRDAREMKATPKIILVQETGEQAAFLIFQPIYNKKMLTGSVEARRKNLKGFVLGVFRIGTLVEDSLSVIGPGGVDLYLYDQSEPELDNRFLYLHASRTRLETSLPVKDEAKIMQGDYYTLPVRVADRIWQVYAVPAPDFFAAHKSWQRWGVPCIVFVFTVLFVGYLYFLFERTEKSKRHAQALSKAINKLEFEIVERNRAENELLNEKENLQEALSEIKTLRGIIPICSYCKKIRDDKGLWEQLEDYLHSHSEAEFSHGACPECFKKQMEEL